MGRVWFKFKAKIMLIAGLVVASAVPMGGLAPVPQIKPTSEPMMRGTWVATVHQLHFPQNTAHGTAALTAKALKEQWLGMLAHSQSLKLNTIIFQVSPSLDAFYPSEHRPWSSYLTNQPQGTPPTWAQDFDLMEWMIDEAHRHGLEFHAWFNPYRVTARSTPAGANKESELAKLAPDNFARLNPHAVYMFGGKLYLDPGYDEVLAHVAATVAEFIARYDVDAVHFDDYFYPYALFEKGEKIHFADQYLDRRTFRHNPREFTFIEEIDSAGKAQLYHQQAALWRADNNNRMVLFVKNVIDGHNKRTLRAVQWGISPFGIWEHQERHVDGSGTPVDSTAALSDMFADTLKWATEESIDYIIPQIYWGFDQPAAPYAALAHWWQKALSESRTHLYIGHGNYKTGRVWHTYDEIARQLRYNQLFPKIAGSAFFSYNDLLPSTQSTPHGTLRNQELSHLTALMNTQTQAPMRPWLDLQPTRPIQNLKFTNSTLTFSDDLTNDTRFYLVYARTISNEPELIQIVGRNKKSDQQAIPLPASVPSTHQIGIAIKDFAGVESEIVWAASGF